MALTKQVLGRIKVMADSYLNNDSTIDDLYTDCFVQDYYIIYNSEAMDFLKENNADLVLNNVVKYHENNYGDGIRFTSMVDLVNEYVRIIAEEIIHEIVNTTDLDWQSVLNIGDADTFMSKIDELINENFESDMEKYFL